MTCPECNGAGRVEISYGDPNDWRVGTGVCGECLGTGEEHCECLRCMTRVRVEESVVVAELEPMRFCRECAAKIRGDVAEVAA